MKINSGNFAATNVEALRDILLNIMVDEQMGIFGRVPPGQMEEWVRAVAARLEKVITESEHRPLSGPRPAPGSLVSPGEIQFLLRREPPGITP